MKRFGLNSGYIGVDRRQTESGIAPLQKAYLERVRGGGYLPGNLDQDATNFLTATGITDPTISSAVRTLVADLKIYGIWTKLKAIYPFVGGTATTHKFNLKDPRDLDAAFRLVFSGGWTHSANGIQGNGVNGFAETYLSTSALTQPTSNISLSIYSRSITSSGGDIGDKVPINTALSGIFINVSNIFYGYLNDINNVNVANTDSRGFYTISRNSNLQVSFYRNGTNYGVNPKNSTANNTNTGTLVIGLVNNQYSSRQYSMASIGDGLTDTEAANYYTAVQAFQTTLSRQV